MILNCGAVWLVCVFFDQEPLIWLFPVAGHILHNQSVSRNIAPKQVVLLSTSVVYSESDLLKIVCCKRVKDEIQRTSETTDTKNIS